MREIGHTVTVSYDGTTALQSVAQFKPDVAFLDIGLPGMDGYELAAHLRLQPASSNALLVALTRYGQESDKQRSLTAGFNLHLVKPVDLQRLQAVINGNFD